MAPSTKKSLQFGSELQYEAEGFLFVANDSCFVGRAKVEKAAGAGGLYKRSVRNTSQ